jgi:hypothetical protein
MHRHFHCGAFEAGIILDTTMASENDIKKFSVATFNNEGGVDYYQIKAEYMVVDSGALIFKTNGDTVAVFVNWGSSTRSDADGADEARASLANLADALKAKADNGNSSDAVEDQVK